MTFFFKLFLFLSTLLVMACKGGKKGVLPIDKMKVVFLHQIMAEEMVNNFYANRDTSLSIDSLQIVSFDKVLKLNGTDSATFYQSLAYYRQDIDRFKILMDSTYAYADRLRQTRYLKNESPNKESENTVEASESDSIIAPDGKANDIDSLVN